MGTGIRGGCYVQFPRLALLLLWSLCANSRGSSLQQQAPKVSDSLWSEQTVVSNLSTVKVSNDGGWTISANFAGPGGCPTGNLSLVFSNATSTGDDVSIPGEMSSQCQTASFLTGTSADFYSIQPGTYRVRLLLGFAKRLIGFSATPAPKGQGSNKGTSPGIIRSNTTLITVARASVANFFGQSASTSRMHATVTLAVGLDGPAELPTSLGLRVWDTSAVEVNPASLTWQPGEADSRAFTLRLTRAAPSGQAAPWAELVNVANVRFSSGTPPRIEIRAPRPKFYVVPNQVLYRSPNDPVSDDSSDSGNSRMINSGVVGGAVVLFAPGIAQMGSVNVEVRRTDLSPFGSTLQYKARLLQVAGCASPACAAAVSASGLTLRFSADNSSAFANLAINWTALPLEAALAVGLQLTPIENAEVVEPLANEVSLYVYGSTYGTCPAGTLGPWQDPAVPALQPNGDSEVATQTTLYDAVPPMPPSRDADASAARGSAGQPAPSSPPTSAAPSQLRNPCNGKSMFQGLLGYNTTEAMLPVLSACAGGEVVAIQPECTTPSEGQPPPPSARGTPKGLPAAPEPPQPNPVPSSDGGGIVVTALELLVPYDQDAVSVFVPLGSVNETVLVMHTNCSPEPRLVQQAVPSASKTGGVAAWAELALPTHFELCYILLQVFASVWSGDATQQQQPQPGREGNSTAIAPPVPPAASSGKPSLPTDPGAGQGPPQAPGGTAGNVNASDRPPPMNTVRAPPSALPSTAPVASEVGSVPRSVRILSMAPLRMFNVTLRPRSNPDIFSAGALSLYLVHHPSGRCLPLCGLASPMLIATGAQLFGDNFETVSQSQLDKAGYTLVQAIRGNPDAVAQLGKAHGADDGSNGGASFFGNRRILHVRERLRRWLATRLPAGWLNAAGVEAGVDGSRGAQDRLARSIIQGRLDAFSLRRILQLNGSSPPPPAQASPLPTPMSRPPGPAQALAGTPAESTLSVLAPSPLSAPPTQSPKLPPWPAAQATSPLAPPPVLPPVPGPGPSSGPVPNYSGTSPTFRAPPTLDGFDLPGGLGDGRPMHVLFNPEFVEWCHAADAQVVDLALLTAPYELGLEARSLGMKLQLGPIGRNGRVDNSTEVVLGPTTRSQLLQQLQEAAVGREGDSSAGDAMPPEPAVNCTAQPYLPKTDKRIDVWLLAPDGVSTARMKLRLYVDFKAAAARECQNSTQSRDSTETIPSFTGSSPSSSSGNSSRVGNASTNGAPPNAVGRPPVTAELLPPPAARSSTPRIITTTSSQPMPMPAPVSLWIACQACGAGSFSNIVNATVCQPCSPGTASNGTYNKECAACDPGTFAAQTGSTFCRLCYAGSYAPRQGSTVCFVCPEGTTSLTDGASECVVPPQPNKGNTAIVVSFQVVLNISATGNSSVGQAASAAGMSDAPADTIFRMLIAADTAAALRIPPSMVRVTLMEVSPSTFLVNVSATMPLSQNPSSNTGSPQGSAPPGNVATSPEVDADTLINRLVGNPDGSFPRTKEATGGSLQVQHVQRQVVVLDDQMRGINPHAVVWPTLGVTALLALALGIACRRYCRRRRARMGLSLPPISDALGRFCTWKYPTSPPPSAHFPYGKFLNLELQDHSPGFSAARHRIGRTCSRSNLPSLGTSLGSDSSDMLTTGSPATADMDGIAMMYTRDVLAAPRI